MPTLAGQCVPAGSSFPIADSNDILGGPMQVADNTARDLIPAGRRRIGMKVWNIATGVEYQLIGGITNSDWVVATLAAGGGITRDAAAPTGAPAAGDNIWIVIGPPAQLYINNGAGAWELIFG